MLHSYIDYFYQCLRSMDVAYICTIISTYIDIVKIRVFAHVLLAKFVIYSIFEL